MDRGRTEACGRCSLTAVVDAVDGTDDGISDADARDDDATDGARDPFAGGHIEVEASAVRAVSPSAWLGAVKRRVDEAVTRLTYGK